ncbi:MAG: lipoyl domain-containing protein [Pseudomonadota bacterium]
MTDITVAADLWEEDVQGVLLTWLFDDGDLVDAGDMVAEVMVDKAQFEIPSPGSGTLHIIKAVDDPVDRGEVIARVV